MKNYYYAAQNVLVKYRYIAAVHIKRLFIYGTINVVCKKCLWPKYYCGAHNVSFYLAKYTDLCVCVYFL